MFSTVQFRNTVAQKFLTGVNANPPGGGHIVLTVIWCQIAQQIIKNKKIEKNT